MKKRKRITGKVVYKNLESGFWGIEDEKGNEYLPVNFPEQLKLEGAAVHLTIQEIEAETLFMWGIPVKILSFHTLNP